MFFWPNIVPQYAATDGVPTARLQYADLLSGLDPVEARLILETAYTVTQIKARQGSHSHAQVLRYYPIVMCALYLNRAQAMLADINTLDQQTATSIYQRMMQYILMTRAERVSGAYF